MNQEINVGNTVETTNVLWNERIIGNCLNNNIRRSQREPYFLRSIFGTHDTGHFSHKATCCFPEPGIFSYVVELAPFTNDANKVNICQLELDSSTSEEEQTIDISTLAERLFELAIEEEFEDGVEGNFSKRIIAFIKENGNDGIGVLAPIFINEKINPEIISEALRWIGRLEHPETEYFRLWLIEKCLFCSSPLIRDGAILGLASLNDPAAIPFLKKAIEKEPIRELQEDMKVILSQLETCLNAIAIAEDQKK